MILIIFPFFLGPRGKVLQATAKIPYQSTWFVQGESGVSSTNDNKLCLNEHFDDIKKLAKQYLQWMQCGQQAELHGVDSAAKRPGTPVL